MMLALIDHRNITSYLKTQQSSEKEAELWAAAIDFFTEISAINLAYIHIAPTHGNDRFEQSAKLHGIPEVWTRYYTENQLQYVDPFLLRVRHSVSPFRFSDTADILDLTPEQMSFLADLKQHVGGDIIGMPVFGPSSRNGSFAIGFKDIPKFNNLDIQLMHWAAQAFHYRICELRIRSQGMTISLTDREKAVLRWMSKGQPDNVISQLLGQSPESLRITINGLYKKFQVRDRNSAVEFAALSGLLRSNGTHH